ncbi:MAG: glycosyltransferase family 4 protein [Geobacteraceae bacterium]|nr:glycosyltransferase family 4 protein [Geobacteraceae bacterium]
MKLLLVNTSRGWGGAEEQMLVMAGELKRRGHDVAVVVRTGSMIFDRFERSGHHVLAVDRKGIRAVAAPFRAAIQARKYRFDVVHCHRDHDLLLGKLIAMFCRVPLVLTQHCYPRKLNRIVYGLADRVVTVSKYIGNGIVERIPSLKERLEVIVNGINPLLFANPDRDFWRRQQPLVDVSGPLLGAVGAFYKGQEELVAMLPHLRKSFPHLLLILIGEDEVRKATLIDKAKHFGVADALVFAGHIPREMMKDALGSLDLNVSAFRNEGFGLSVIEGMLVGTPFVGYKAGGYPEIVNSGKNGYLVDTNEEMMGILLHLLHDHKMMKNISANAEMYVNEHFSFEIMLDSYESLYLNLINRDGIFNA